MNLLTFYQREKEKQINIDTRMSGFHIDQMSVADMKAWIKHYKDGGLRTVGSMNVVQGKDKNETKMILTAILNHYSITNLTLPTKVPGGATAAPQTTQYAPTTGFVPPMSQAQQPYQQNTFQQLPPPPASGQQNFGIPTPSFQMPVPQFQGFQPGSTAPTQNGGGALVQTPIFAIPPAVTGQQVPPMQPPNYQNPGNQPVFQAQPPMQQTTSGTFSQQVPVSYQATQIGSRTYSIQDTPTARAEGRKLFGDIRNTLATPQLINLGKFVYNKNQLKEMETAAGTGLLQNESTGVVLSEPVRVQLAPATQTAQTNDLEGQRKKIATSILDEDVTTMIQVREYATRYGVPDHVYTSLVEEEAIRIRISKAIKNSEFGQSSGSLSAPLPTSIRSAESAQQPSAAIFTPQMSMPTIGGSATMPSSPRTVSFRA